MVHLKKFENYNIESTLIIVDVQEYFKKFFNDAYIAKLNTYCKLFTNVYQIWDNHVDGKTPDKDYLYDNNPEIPINNKLYRFPNQKHLIEKRYNYDVDSDFFRKILDKKTYKEISDKESNNQLVKGQVYKTKEDTIIVFIGNNHNWFHVPVKLYQIFLKLKGQQVTIVGGADSECLEDIVIAGESLGVTVKRDYRYIYSASHKPSI